MSRRRTYLNLKQSIIQLFKTPAHWLKEFTGKWSIFEKPYLDRDYRGMHLKWSGPDWPSDPKVGLEKPGKATFIFDDGVCWLGTIAADCGESFSLSATIALTAFPEEGTQIAFNAVSSEPDNVRITDVVVDGLGSAKIKGELADNWTGVATICVDAKLTAGSFLKEFSVLNPYGEGPGILSWDKALELPKIGMLRSLENRWDCGCLEIEVTCCVTTGTIAYDWDTSAETIAPSNTCTVAITYSLGLTGEELFRWEVTGTGFSFEVTETTGLTNILTAAADSCGTAIISVFRCDEGSTSAIGKVRSTIGQWDFASQFCNCYGAGTFYNCIRNGTQYKARVSILCIATIACTCCPAVEGLCTDWPPELRACDDPGCVDPEEEQKADLDIYYWNCAP